jgi:type II secretory pathway pseudopilin PulG
MSSTASLSAAIQRLSPRERMLGGIALLLVLVIGLVYGGLAPGMSAAKSAATRNTAAVSDLAQIRSLALSAASGAPFAMNASEAKRTAEAVGLVVSDQQMNDDELTMIVTGPNPQTVLSWLAANANVAAIEGFAIEGSSDGGVTARVRFMGTVR